ncbi:MAG: flagellar protein FlaG [candidate division Zixibacteria bacterium]|jgi:flagellar protein FlaG|nr:flagellar protein FlaG [candidate division Zixibacteria bacterium]
MYPMGGEMSDSVVSSVGREFLAVSDAAESPAVDTKVKSDLVSANAQSSSAAGTEKDEQTKPQLRELIEDSIQTLNTELEQRRISLNYSIDDDSDCLVVQVIESDSGKVIRQIPPEEILVLRQRLEELTGIIFDTQV